MMSTEEPLSGTSLTAAADPHAEAPAPAAQVAHRLRPLHPLFFAAFPALTLLAHNRHETRLLWAMMPLLSSLLATAAIWALLWLVMRRLATSALVTSLAVLFFFSFGHVTAQLGEWSGATPGSYHAAVLLGESALLVIVFAMLYRRFDYRPVAATRFANVVSLVLVALPLINLASFEIRAWRAAGAAASVLASPDGSGAAGTITRRPDIYLIVPDAHARSDVMRDLYQHDMEPFLSELESLGFTVARRSAANYGLTPVSLASMLNYRYIEEYNELPAYSFRPYEELIRSSALVAVLKEAGYKTVAFPSSESYSEMKHFDRFEKNPAGGAAFNRLYVELTPLAPILGRSRWWNAYVSQRDRIIETLNRLPEVASDSAPTFTFLHISIPHPPFRFDADGRDVFDRFRDLEDNGKSGRPEKDQPRYRDAYREQCVYTDHLLLRAIRQILEESQEPPIILLISDHGPRLNMHWDVPELTDVREAMGNLTAVYLPEGRGGEAIYPTITPANLVRVVLNEWFGAQLPLLPDRSFLLVNHEGWYRLEEVTDRLEEDPEVPTRTSPAQSTPPQGIAKARDAE